MNPFLKIPSKLALIAVFLCVSVDLAQAKPRSSRQTQGGLNVDRFRLNQASDFGPGSSLRYGGYSGYDPRYSLGYEGFSSGLYPRSYFPSTGYYDYYTASGTQAPTTVNLVNGLFDVFFGEGGGIGARWSNYWRDSLLKPFGAKALYLAIGKSPLEKWLGGIGAYTSRIPQTGGRVMSPFARGCLPDQYSSGRNLGDIFSYSGGRSAPSSSRTAIENTLNTYFAGQSGGTAALCGDASFATSGIGSSPSPQGTQTCADLGFSDYTQCVRCDFGRSTSPECMRR